MHSLGLSNVKASERTDERTKIKVGGRASERPVHRPAAKLEFVFVCSLNVNTNEFQFFLLLLLFLFLLVLVPLPSECAFFSPHSSCSIAANNRIGCSRSIRSLRVTNRQMFYLPQSKPKIITTITIRRISTEIVKIGC